MTSRSANTDAEAAESIEQMMKIQMIRRKINENSDTY